MIGFGLTFQKRFVRFPNENNCKTYLKCCPPWLGDKEIFHSRLPKTVLDSIFLPFYLTEKHQFCILYNRTFIKMNFIKELCKKSFENTLN